MKMISSVSPLASQADERARQKRLAKRYNDPDFRERVNLTKRFVQQGVPLGEAREKVGLDKQKFDDYWDDVVYVIAHNYFKTENLVLEWTIRQQVRYQMALETYNMAKKDNDLGEMNKAIMLMMKVDENSLQLQQAMGLIKPMKVDDNDQGQGEGISHEQLLLTEERILRKYQLQRDAQPPITIDVQHRSSPGGETDSVEQTPLAQDSTRGPLEGNNIP